MRKFCEKCGVKLDEKTGLCPKCDTRKIEALSQKDEEIDKTAAKDKKQAQWPIWKIVRRLLLWTTLIILSTVGVIAFVLKYHWRKTELNLSNFVPMDQIEQEESVIEYPGGDVVFVPGCENLAYDQQNAVVFYNNTLSVYLLEELDDEAAKALAETVDGEIVGWLQGSLNVLQIKVSDSTFSELNEKAEKLMENESVLYASYDYPMEMEAASAGKDPWSANKNAPENDLGNEETPGGNDWWAEAIGAYSAWKYEDQCQPITVGILDAGFDLEHEDLSGQIQMLAGYESNSPDDHGTHVAGLIAAKDNDIGIKGIVSHAKLLCADFSTTKDGQAISLITNSEYRKIIKQMVEEKAQVINNSWGTTMYSEEGYVKEEYLKEEKNLFIKWYVLCHPEKAWEFGIHEEYEAYLNWMENRSKKKSMECAVLISSMLLNDDHFLIIQSAGNGYDNKGPGYDAKLTGSFRGIDSELFNHLGAATRNKLQQRGISYQTIKDHIIVVGAVENIKNEQGQYKMRASSNFGNTVDICAPGEEVFSTVTLSDDAIDEPLNNEYDGKQYDNMSGTSMAAPMVTGSAAYIWSLCPDLTAAEVKEVLCNGTSVRAYGVGDGNNRTYPMLNLGASVQKLMDGRKPPEEEKDTALISLPELLDGWWDGSIQTAMAYKFRENGTVDVYSGLGGMEYLDTYTYHLDGNHLTIERPKYPIELDFVKKDDSMKWTYGAEEGEMFFLDTGWVSSGEPSDQPEYLRRMQSTPDIRLDNKYKYAYEDGEFLSELYIDSENSTPRTASLGFWHNYGNSPSHEDFNFEWEDGKWQYEVLGNRSQQMFLLEFSPVENGMQVIVTCKEGTTYAWPSMEPSKVWIEAVYKKE